MEGKTVSVAVVAALVLVACGGGGGDTGSAVGGGQGGGAAIDMDAPFSQTLDCYHGVKPYRNPGVSDTFTVSFTGSELQFTDFNGVVNKRLPFADTVDYPVQRENYPSSALVRVQLGATGGTLYFVKTGTGEVISTGHNDIGGDGASSEYTECGGEKAAEWVSPVIPPVLSASEQGFDWTTGSGVALNCARFGATPSRFAASLRATAGGAMQAVANGEAFIDIPGVDVPGREYIVIPISPRAAPGGLIDWTSRPAGAGAAGTSSYRVAARWDSQLLALTEWTNDGSGTRKNCWPAPLIPVDPGPAR